MEVAPPTEYPPTAPDNLFHHAKTRPHAAALREKRLGIWHDVTWRQYAENVRAVGYGLLALGVEPGECVAVIGENRPEWLYADLATQAIGGITVGIYTTNSPVECEYILGHSESRIYLVENEEQLDKALEVRERLPHLEKIVVMDMEGLRGFSDPMVISWADFLAGGERHRADNISAFDERLAAIDPESTALLIYTSGTTGPPKGAMLTHRNVTWTAHCLVRLFGVGPQEEVISFLPLAHIAERMLSVYIAAAAGYCVNFVESPETVAQNMAEVSPTFMFSVPRIWEKYQSTIFIRMKDATLAKRLAFGAALWIGRRYAAAKLANEGRAPLHLRALFLVAHVAVLAKLRERLGLDRLRQAVSGAAAISPDVLRFFHAIGVPLRQLYGQTEDTGPTTVHRGDVIDPANAGPPIPGVEIRIADDGEILVRGPNVFKGYYKNPQATAETLEDGWLHSGDVGEIDDRGFLKITDRKKDLIITSSGKNIAPQNIENQLKYSSYITDAIVIGDGRHYVTALIVIDEENVIKFAREHKVPFFTYAALTQAREVRELILEEVKKVNATLARIEQIKRFVILPKKLLEEDGEVTPTMKVKRRAINATFGDLIEGMYRGTEGVNV